MPHPFPSGKGPLRRPVKGIVSKEGKPNRAGEFSRESAGKGGINMEFIHGVAMADGEQVVREYKVTRMDRPKADGYLAVTNRRLIFASEAQGIAGRSALVRETHIPDISGLTGYIGKGLSIGRVILIVILALIGIALGSAFWPLFVFLAIPAYMAWRLLSSPGTEIILVVHARGQSESPVALVAEQATGMFGLFGGHARLAGVVLGPGPDAERALQEIGALVLDLQSSGDMALERWVKTEPVLA